MALFDFKCSVCGETFEEDMPLEWSEMGHMMLCPECGGLAEKQFKSPPPKHFSWAAWRVPEGND